MYTIREVCMKTGLSAHTLRYYEKEGLLTNVERSSGGFRQYSDEDLEWLGLICCLKNTGMPLHEIARFVNLAHKGDNTLKDRVELLKDHREKMLSRIAEMEQYLAKITWKVNYFSEKLQAYEQSVAENPAAPEA